MMEMPGHDTSRTTFKHTQQCTYTAALCTLTQVVLPEMIFLLFVVPGNIYHQLNIVKGSILPLNMLGQIMLPVKAGVLGASETQER